MSQAKEPAQYAAGGQPDASCRCCAEHARSTTGLIAYAPAQMHDKRWKSADQTEAVSCPRQHQSPPLHRRPAEGKEGHPNDICVIGHATLLGTRACMPANA